MRLALITALVAFVVLLPRGLAANGSVPRLDHVFVIIEENQSRANIIGNTTDAPNLNKLAATYGQATNFFAETHPSEPNYVAMVGGSNFGISDDDDYACPNLPLAPNTVGCGSISTDTNYPNHTVYGNNLAKQVDNAGLTWKGYFQSLPSDGYTGDCFPGTSGNCLYASKHNPFINFDYVQNHDLSKIVKEDKLDNDLKNGNVPNVSFIVPDQCNDMHGQGVCTGLSGSGSCDQHCLITTGDAYAQKLVDKITGSKFWKTGRNVIVITWDESEDPLTPDPLVNAGCCDAGVTTAIGGGAANAGGGGDVATIVITNTPNPQNILDATPYNHYSLLRTIEDGIDLGCVQNSCDKTHIQPMTPLLAGI